MQTRLSTIVAAALAVVLAAGPVAHTASASEAEVQRRAPRPTADYRFSGDLTSSVGSAPALRNINAAGRNRFRTRTEGGSTLRFLQFPDGNGLRLRSATRVVNPGVYTMALTVRFDELLGYTRIVNFAGDAADTGLYALNDTLVLYSSAQDSEPMLTPDEWATIVITRTGAGIVRVYVDGTEAFRVDDRQNGYARISDAGELWFFRDNANREEGSGAVDRIRLWDVALTSPQVAALGR